MGSNFFDIPFRTLSGHSDFACKDGEIVDFENLDVSCGGIPQPDIDFALVRDSLKGWHAVAEDFPAKSIVATDPGIEYWTLMASQLLSRFQNEATSQNLFVAPFFVRAAWKTGNGGYISPTRPVILTPNSVVPAVAADDNIDATELSLRIAGAVCSLYFRMRSPEKLRKWTGRIVSLDILVSNPLLKFEKFTAVIPSRRVGTDNYCRSLDISTGEIADRKVCTVIPPLSWTATVPEVRKISYRPFASVPFSEIDIADKWGKAGNRGNGDFFYGLEAAGLTSEELGDVTAKGGGEIITVNGSDSDFSLTTRPLKLSGAGKFKEIRRVFLRGHYSPSRITILVYGSRDMMKWWPLAQKKGVTVVTLPRSAFRFYKVALLGYLASDETLEGLSLF